MSRRCCHRHKLSGETSYNMCHDHDYKCKTSYTQNGCQHTHYVEFCTKKDDGHKHYCCLETGPACYCENGEHFHYVCGPVQCACGHDHYINDCTSTECEWD